MQNELISWLAWPMIISSSLMAGTYFAFSGIIMKTLDNMGAIDAIRTMNAINKDILRSSFMPLFFCSTMIACLLIVVGLWHWESSNASKAVAAGAFYVIGMFMTTAVANVPLNNRLALIDGADPQDRITWGHYFQRWSLWNSLRAVASILTTIICIHIL